MANLDSDIAALKLQIENVEKELIEKGVDVKERLSLLAPHRNLLIQHMKQKADAEGGAADAKPGIEADVSPLTKFERLCGQRLTTSQMGALFTHQGALAAMVTGFATKEVVMHFYAEIKSLIQTSTRQAIENEKGYAFDGRIGSGGQVKSSLSFVFKDAGVYCGKAYANNQAAMELEMSVSQAVHSDQAVPTLIKVIDGFHAGSHSVLILPLLAKSAADLRFAQPNGISSEAAAYVCVGVLAAVAGLATKGWCHADIKPANIMLAGNEKSAVLVDLGSCTRIGEEITEWTEGYALDLPRLGGLQWDLACLASTLCVLSNFGQLGSTVAHVQERLAGLQDTWLPLGCRLASCILGHSGAVSSVAELKERVWEDVMGLVRGSLGEETTIRSSSRGSSKGSSSYSRRGNSRSSRRWRWVHRRLRRPCLRRRRRSAHRSCPASRTRCCCCCWRRRWATRPTRAAAWCGSCWRRRGGGGRTRRS